MKKIILLMLILLNGCCNQPTDLNLDGYLDVDFDSETTGTTKDLRSVANDNPE